MKMQQELFPETEFSFGEIQRKKALCVIEDRDNAHHATVVDLTGQRFGMLEILGDSGERNNGGVVWVAKCDCGITIKATSRKLNQHKSPLRDCGCARGRPGTNGVSGIRRTHKNNEDAARHHLFLTYNGNATRRGKEFALTYSEFKALTLQPCHYCGVPPSQEQKSHNHSCVYNGIDRINPSSGYTTQNTVSCCGQCNRAKYTYSLSEFREWAIRLADKLKEMGTQ